MILIACEESQRITIEYRKRGFEAYSCDILPCSGGHPKWHIQTDVRKIANDPKWKLIIAHPPCTCLSVCGAAWFAKKKAHIDLFEKRNDQERAIEFFLFFTTLECNKIAIENPAGIMSTVYRKPDQYIQPYEHGHPYTKRTGFWLKNLPKLKPTNLIKPEKSWVSSGKKGGAIASHDDQTHERSKTFPGIAKAISEQWIP